MGEAPGCPYKGNVQLEYGACDVKCGKYINTFLFDLVPGVVNSVVLSHFVLYRSKDIFKVECSILKTAKKAHFRSLLLLAES